MSVLFFHQEPDGVAIITDTLATRTDGTPLFFASKTFYYPTLNMVMAATGVYQLALRWNQEMLEKVSVKDIDNLDDFATDSLIRLWNELIEKEDAPHGITSTIYHFGWSKKHKQYIRYVYRSEKEFESEKELGSAIGIKPQPKEKHTLAQAEDDPIEAIKTIRKEQDELPHEKKIYIGGELVLAILKQNVGIQSKVIYTFDDYEDHWAEMNRHY